MIEEAYKVVRIVNGLRYSISVVAPFMMEYLIDGVTYPLVGKLFVYKDVDAARALAECEGWSKAVELWRCEVTGLKKAPLYMAEFDEPISISNYWRSKTDRDTYATFPIPCTTYLADSVKLVECIWSNEAK